MLELFEKDKPIVSGFDTETTGLHLIRDKPFLIIFGWLIPKKKYGRVFTFYPTKENMELFLELAKRSKVFVGHNVTYDLSMLRNIGYKYEEPNIVENMVVARLSLEALSANDGGDNLALTDLGTKYVHPLAKHSELKVKEELRKLNRERVNVLTAALKDYDHPTETQRKVQRYDENKGKWINTTKSFVRNNHKTVKCREIEIPKKWTKRHVEDFLKDITNDVDDLPEEIRYVWETWNKEYPEPTYADIDRDLMIKYACEDVITMLEFFKKAIKVVKKREQLDVLRRESKLIPAIVEMERHGFKVDRPYLEESRVRVKNYIIKKRKEMYKLAGEIVNVSQHATIVKVFRNNWNIEIPNCDKGVLNRIINGTIQENVPEEAKKYAKLISELRSLEKWYSTYIVRVLERSEYDGRLYMQLNQAGAISGRFSSDGQQFPKGAIKDDEGNELYHPRRAFIAAEGRLWYFLLFPNRVEKPSQLHAFSFRWRFKLM